MAGDNDAGDSRDPHAPVDAAASLPPGFRHDLLNHLNAAGGFTDLLLFDLPPGPLRDHAARVRQCVSAAQALAQSLPRPQRLPGRPLLLVAAGAGGDRLEQGLTAAGALITRAVAVADAVQALKAAPRAWTAVIVDTSLHGADMLLGVAAGSGLQATAVAPSEPAADILARLDGND